MTDRTLDISAALREAQLQHLEASLAAKAAKKNNQQGRNVHHRIHTSPRRGFKRLNGTPSQESIVQALKAMRLNADDFVPLRHKTMGIEIGGAHDGRHSTPADRRSRLTFWLLQQSQP